MYIAVLVDPEFLELKEVYDKKISKDTSENQSSPPNFDEITKESPLTGLQMVLEAYDNKVEFLIPGEKLQSFLDMGKFDLVLNTSSKKGTNFKPAHYVALIDLTSIPFTGSKMETVGLCKNKALFKSLLRLNYIATAPFKKLKIQRGDLPSLKLGLKFPVVVKFFTEGIHDHAIQDQLAQDKDELEKILESFAKKYEFSYVLVEEYIPGRKFYLPVMGNDLNENIRFLPMLEYEYPGAEHPQDYIGKNHPSPNIKYLEITHPLVKRARKVAKKAYNFFNCRDYAMAVFLLDKRNENLLLHELNPITSLLPGSKMVRAALHIGISYEELVNDIILYTLIRYNQKLRGKYGKRQKQLQKE